jgi:hypothetical protein
LNEERGRQSAQGTEKPGTPWGFFLVLAAIVVVAIVYSVTIYLIDQRTPEVVFGAMAACFTVIGTLVGTYFGVKAGLDGQDKLRQTLARIDYGARERLQDDTDINGDRTNKGRQAEDGQREARGPQEIGKGAHVERRDWDGGSV